MSKHLALILAVWMVLTIELCVFTTLFAVVDGQVANADEVYKARPKPPTDGLVGANYTPAYAVNQVQFWHDFRAEVVEKELAAAQKYFCIKTLRVYLHNINFDEEKDVLFANLEKFLTICEKHRIRPGFVFFDDCPPAQGNTNKGGPARRWRNEYTPATGAGANRVAVNSAFLP